MWPRRPWMRQSPQSSRRSPSGLAGRAVRRASRWSRSSIPIGYCRLGAIEHAAGLRFTETWAARAKPTGQMGQLHRPWRHSGCGPGTLSIWPAFTTFSTGRSWRCRPELWPPADAYASQWSDPMADAAGPPRSQLRMNPGWRTKSCCEWPTGSLTGGRISWSSNLGLMPLVMNCSIAPLPNSAGMAIVRTLPSRSLSDSQTSIERRFETCQLLRAIVFDAAKRWIWV